MNDYIDQLIAMRMNTQGGHTSPHKAVMMLAVIDMVASGDAEGNRIEYGPELLEHFRRYFDVVKTPADSFTPILPFFHLRSSPFWHHRPVQGQEAVCVALNDPGGPRKLQSVVEYAFLDDELFALLSDYPKPKDGEDKKIVIRELWSSYHFWKTASTSYELCDDAKAFNREMKRRVELFKSTNTIQNDGERSIVIGKDPDGKCDGLELITREIGSQFTAINNRSVSTKLQGTVLGPLYQQDGEDDDTFNDKNRQSIVLQITIKESGYDNNLLLAADAECSEWEALWSSYKNETEKLQYDILQAPHHCSWHSLSYDSQSKDENPAVCEDAKSALSQTKAGSCIVSQSKPIKNDDDDPPSHAAKDEYLTIVPKNRFYCTNEYPNEEKPEPLEFNLTGSGPQETRENAIICSKVNLADIFFVVRPNENMAYRNKIDRKHVDFLLCDPKSLRPLIGIELDDSSHKRTNRQERDRFVDDVFKTAELSLVHVPAQTTYNVRELTALLGPHLECLVASPAPEPVELSVRTGEAPLCEKCGIPMVMRTVSRGDRKGERFWGCANYPKCRKVIADLKWQKDR